MPDIEHLYGNDLTVSNTGDLAVVTGTQFGTERVIRRLMTASGQYIFHLDYGAGLPEFLGLPAFVQQIQGVIQQQMQLETAVSQSPIPSVGVSSTANSVVTANVQYVDSTSGESAVLSIPIAP